MKLPLNNALKITIRFATDDDRNQIYHLRHRVYAQELGQHPTNDQGSLCDSLDRWNEYLVAALGTQIIGFISITPSESPGYSLDKYLDRKDYPSLCGPDIHEVRLLTVMEGYREGLTASILLYAAIRSLQCRKAERIVGMGRQEVLKTYRSIGFKTIGKTIACGKTQFEAMHLRMSNVDPILYRFRKVIARIRERIHWDFEFPFEPENNCYHGGASIESIAGNFDDLDRRHQIINADVLDAWFPPCPKAISEITRHLPWLMRSSPPTQADGLNHAIAKSRNIPIEHVVTGAGSSDLIFHAFGAWLQKDSRVLLVTPCYGEYEFICKQVLGTHVDYFKLSRQNDFTPDIKQFQKQVLQGYDLVVIVNPNNPTGKFLTQGEMLELLSVTPSQTRFWIDECYVDFVDDTQSLQREVTNHDNLVICKSMSKIYGLSGMRVGYLCLPPHLATPLRQATPPWNIGMLSQLAAIASLGDKNYFAKRYQETHRLRLNLESQLIDLGLDVVPGTGNYILFYLHMNRVAKLQFLKGCVEEQIHLRDLEPTSPCLGHDAIRIAVKDQDTNQRMVNCIARQLEKLREDSSQKPT